MITCELDFRMHIDRDFIVVVADVDTLMSYTLLSYLIYIPTCSNY